MSTIRDRVDAVLTERRARFIEINETDSLAQQITQNEQTLRACTTRRDIRRRNALLRSNESLRSEISRRRRKQQLFETLAMDVREAAQIAERRPDISADEILASDESQPKRKRKSEIKADEYASDAALLLEDVILLDDGETLQDARTQVDDVCTNCGRQMERNVQLSYLVCPNLECGHMRWYMDTSTCTSAAAYATRTEIVKNAPKCVTHYSTFLNTAQGKTTKRFSRDFLMEICFYCYVEGARKPEDITKKMINKAQKYRGKTDYGISTLLKTQLRGDNLRLPPEIVRWLQMLFKAVWPVFEMLKADLDDDRSNMVNFNFVSRVLCRLIGYDVFLPLFETFRLPPNQIKHSAFMRRMFRELGWVWEDGKLTEVPDSLLDEYEQREAQGQIVDEGDDEADAGAIAEADMRFI